MTVEEWTEVWRYVLLGASALFALIAVVVAIGGAFDLRSMFRAMSRDDGESK